MIKIAKLIFQTSQMSQKKKTNRFLFYRNPYDLNVIIPTNLNHLRTRKMSAFMQCFKDLKKLTIIKLWQSDQNKKLNIIGISATLLITWYLNKSNKEDKGKSTSVFLAAKFKSKHRFAISVMFANFLCFE